MKTDLTPVTPCEQGAYLIQHRDLDGLRANLDHALRIFYFGAYSATLGSRGSMNDLSAVGSKYVSSATPVSTRPYTASVPVHHYMLRVARVRRDHPMLIVVAFDSHHLLRGFATRRIVQHRRDSFHYCPIQLRLFPGILFLHHDPGISVADRIFANFLQSLSGNCFNFPFRAGVSCACLVYHVPDQPTICVVDARLRSAVIPDIGSSGGNRCGGRSL